VKLLDRVTFVILVLDLLVSLWFLVHHEYQMALAMSATGVTFLVLFDPKD
jgi:hypothetical protein